MIGGFDIVLDSTVEPRLVLEKALHLIVAYWPNAVVENPDTGNLLNSPSEAGACANFSGILVYKDLAYRDAWIRVGGEPENLGTMIHVLASPGMATMVVDDPNEP